MHAGDHGAAEVIIPECVEQHACSRVVSYFCKRGMQQRAHDRLVFVLPDARQRHGKAIGFAIGQR